MIVASVYVTASFLCGGVHRTRARSHHLHLHCLYLSASTVPVLSISVSNQWRRREQNSARRPVYYSAALPTGDEHNNVNMKARTWRALLRMAWQKAWSAAPCAKPQTSIANETIKRGAALRRYGGHETRLRAENAAMASAVGRGVEKQCHQTTPISRQWRELGVGDGHQTPSYGGGAQPLDNQTGMHSWRRA